MNVFELVIILSVSIAFFILLRLFIAVVLESSTRKITKLGTLTNCGLFLGSFQNLKCFGGLYMGPFCFSMKAPLLFSYIPLVCVGINTGTSTRDYIGVTTGIHSLAHTSAAVSYVWFLGKVVQDESCLFIKGRPLAVPEKFVLSFDATFQTCTILRSISGKPHAVASEEVSEFKRTGHRRQGHRTDASWRYSEG